MSFGISLSAAGARVFILYPVRTLLRYVQGSYLYCRAIMGLEEPRIIASVNILPTAIGLYRRITYVNSGRERRKRNRVTPEQLIQLEAAFNKARYPISTERRELSNRIGMAERAVQIWFQNRSVGFFCTFSPQQTYFLSLARRAKAKHQPPRAAAPTANPPPIIDRPSGQ